MGTYWGDLANELEGTEFLEKFLEVYIRNGYGALPKREVNLVLLELVARFAPSWKDGPPTTYTLARNLRISPRRVQSLLDEIAYRDESKTDEWCAEQLREALRNAEKIKDGSWVQFQIDDGLVRDYAVARVRQGYGIVDTSFNSSVVKLSGERFAALVLSLLPEAQAKEVVEVIDEVDRTSEQDSRETKGPVRLFVDAFATKAGETAGKKAVELGFALLTGGASEAVEIVKALVSGKSNLSAKGGAEEDDQQPEE